MPKCNNIEAAGFMATRIRALLPPDR
jgi:hypothetical protein